MVPRLAHRDLRRLPGLLAEIHAAKSFECLLNVVFDVSDRLVSSDSQNYYDVTTFAKARSRPAEPEVSPVEETRYEVRGHNRRLRYFVAARPLRMDLDTAAVCSGFERHVLDHPVLVQNRKQRSLETYRLSDLVTDREMIKTPLYNEFFRYFPVRRQIITYIDFGRERDVVLALARGPGADFSDRDIQIVRVLAPTCDKPGTRYASSKPRRNSCRKHGVCSQNTGWPMCA